MAGLADQSAALTKSTAVAAVLQVVLAVLTHYTAAGQSGTVQTVGQPAIAGIGGLLMSLLSKGATSQTAAGGGAVAGGASGVVAQIANSLMGGAGGDLAAGLAQNTALTGAVGALGAMIGQYVNKPKAQ
jgi:hypothetical protein